jgi:hypothetical protein
MGYLSSFRNDIFFSYAHGPISDLSISPEEERYLQRWTTCLAKDVVQHVNFYLQQKDPAARVKGWIDRSLMRTIPVDNSLEQEVRASGILFCVMTNFYLASSFCLKEINWFKDTYANEGENTGRIFLIRATRTDREEWPKALKRADGSALDGYKFYENVEADQIFYDPFGWPVPQVGDAKYWGAVRTVAIDAAKKLWDLKKRERLAAEPAAVDSISDQEPAGPAAEVQHTDLPSREEPVGPVTAIAAGNGARQKVFLGLMHDTLLKVREDIRLKLQELGFCVVPDLENEPYDKTTLDAALASLNECQASILVANEYCGRWPNGEAGGFVSYQMGKFRENNIPTHLWIDVRDTSGAQTREYGRYLDQILAEGGMQFSDVNEFCHSFAQIRSSIAGFKLAFVATNRPSEDKAYTDFQDAVSAAISDTGRLIFTSNLSAGSQNTGLVGLDTTVGDVDTLAIICFDQKWSWATHLMGQLRQLRKNNRQKRRQLLVTGPVAAQPLSLDARTLGFDTVDGTLIDLAALKTSIASKLEKSVSPAPS